jgi:predicted RecA/RadA family phage recombinase
MATNKATWIRNLNGHCEPLVMLGLFQAGATQAVKRGEILELSGGNWIPLDADQSMAGVIAVANEEIKAGDRAGYYEIIVPRPGDVFEFELAAAGATAVGTALYFSTSQKLTVTAGSNVIGNAVGQEHYPQKQGHLSDEPGGDAGTTVRNTSYVRMTFKAAASYYAALQT